MSIITFLLIHNICKNDGLRLGQRFVNMYIKGSWPELFYANDVVAYDMIQDWLDDHHYYFELPPVVNPLFLENGELKK